MQGGFRVQGGRRARCEVMLVQVVQILGQGSGDEGGLCARAMEGLVRLATTCVQQYMRQVVVHAPSSTPTEQYMYRIVHQVVRVSSSTY